MAYKGIKIKIGNADAYDTAVKYGIYVKDFPFIPVPLKQKNIFSQSWYDENGDDEFIPSTAYYEPVTISVPFVTIGSLSTCLTNIRAFISELSNVLFKIYDEYSTVGRQECRLVQYSESASVMKYRGSASKVVAEFALEIKINDPVTNISLDDSSSD